MNFYVMESPPFDSVTKVPALETLQGCMDFGFQHVTLIWGSEKETPISKYVVVKVPVADSLETGSEDFTSYSDAAPDVDEDSKKLLLLWLKIYVHVMITSPFRAFLAMIKKYGL